MLEYPRPQTVMETAHLHQKKATGVTVPTYVLDSGQKIGARTNKQTFTLQDHPKTCMDVRRNPVGHSLSFEH
jgi:hypothetical protein